MAHKSSKVLHTTPEYDKCSLGPKKGAKTHPEWVWGSIFPSCIAPKWSQMAPKWPPQASLSTLGSCSGSLNRIWVFWGPKQTQNSTRAMFRAQTVQILKWGPKNLSKIATVRYKVSCNRLNCWWTWINQSTKTPLILGMILVLETFFPLRYFSRTFCTFSKWRKYA